MMEVGLAQEVADTDADSAGREEAAVDHKTLENNSIPDTELDRNTTGRIVHNTHCSQSRNSAIRLVRRSSLPRIHPGPVPATESPPSRNRDVKCEHPVQQ